MGHHLAPHQHCIWCLGENGTVYCILVLRAWNANAGTGFSILVLVICITWLMTLVKTLQSLEFLVRIILLGGIWFGRFISCFFSQWLRVWSLPWLYRMSDKIKQLLQNPRQAMKPLAALVEATTGTWREPYIWCPWFLWCCVLSHKIGWFKTESILYGFRNPKKPSCVWPLCCQVGSFPSSYR